MIANIVINLPDTEPDWEAFEDGEGLKVGKMVLGKSPGQGGSREESLQIHALPANFATTFKNLTHLHLWGIKGLKNLPTLPPNLECLDLRGCADMETLPRLPGSLDTLLLDGCEELRVVPNLEAADFPKLSEVSLKDCRALPEKWIHDLLANSAALRIFDASGCALLTGISALPTGLVDLRLNNCQALAKLPPDWPENLRRLELNNAKLIPSLADFGNALDFVRLTGMEGLSKLPEKRGNPRSLFLHGSGLLMPPASELGESPKENVAQQTKGYFEDVDLVGKGAVKRCKVLLLGNGEAGKTCLALALTKRRPLTKKDLLGSTHGVQFFDYDFGKNIEGKHAPVHLHLWDFGGQEIYHNTHRLFMSKGAVFVVLWNPEQDGAQPDPNQTAYQDTWRTLQYWVEFIRLACPHKPRIAVVCSHHTEATAELKARWGALLSERDRAEISLFCVDSVEHQGQIGLLEDWIKKETGEVVATQGTAVPTYWEVAQDMVEAWVQQMEADPKFHSTHKQVSLEFFQASLQKEIKLAANSAGYPRLAASVRSGAFTLTEDRLGRTLSFLTHSGWLYWNPRLFEGRVIIGQKWALDGLYSILDRGKAGPVYDELRSRHGVFRLSQLAEWAWNKAGYSSDEQQLLLSFMVQCGLCFKLRAAAAAWAGEDVYASFEHLDTSSFLGLQAKFDELSDPAQTKTDIIKCPRLHTLHWQKFLTEAGTMYGAGADYARDGFFLRNTEGQSILIVCESKPDANRPDGDPWIGLGGTIRFQVSGPKAEETLKGVVAHVGPLVRGEHGAGSAGPEKAMGKASPGEKVFISYAWNSKKCVDSTGSPINYEGPVDAIEAFLKGKGVEVMRDKDAVKFGDDLRLYMEKGSRAPRVIMVHSKRYWLSPNCIYELDCVNEELRKVGKKEFKEAVIPVELEDSGIRNEGLLGEKLDFWSKFTAYDHKSPIPWKADELCDHARSLLRKLSKDLKVFNEVNIEWSDGETAALDEIARRLGVGAQSPEGDSLD